MYYLILYITFRFHFPSQNKKTNILNWFISIKIWSQSIHAIAMKLWFILLCARPRRFLMESCSGSGPVTLKNPILSCWYSFFGGSYFVWIQPELKIFPPVAVASVLWRPSLVCSFPSPCRLAAGGCRPRRGESSSVDRSVPGTHVPTSAALRYTRRAASGPQPPLHPSVSRHSLLFVYIYSFRPPLSLPKLTKPAGLT